MRRARGLFEALVSPGFLQRRAMLFARGKRRRPDVAALLFNLEPRLESLRARLAAGRWAPAGWEVVRVRDPKPRLICRAPVDDRVVQAGLGALLEPLILRSAAAESFACRSGFGTERARLRLCGLMRAHVWCLHLDIRAYFPSVRLDILRGMLWSRVADATFMGILELVLAAGAGLYDAPADRAFLGFGDEEVPRGEGLPVGALTSQLLATHLYLAPLDTHVKRQLRVPGYLRYVDDLFLFADDRRQLVAARDDLAGWLGEHLLLRLKHPDAPTLSTRGALDGLGVRVRRAGLTPLPAALRRLGARVWRVTQAGPMSDHEEAALHGQIRFLLGQG